MGKTAATAMTFEKSPVRSFAKRKGTPVKTVVKKTTDINEMKSYQIVTHLLARHQTLLWALAAVTTWAILIVK